MQTANLHLPHPYSLFSLRHPALSPAVFLDSSAADNSVSSCSEKIKSKKVTKNKGHYAFVLVYLHKAFIIMADSPAAPPKPSSSVKLVLLGEAAVGKV